MQCGHFYLCKNSTKVARCIINALKIAKAIEVQLELVTVGVFWKHSGTDRVENYNPIPDYNIIIVKAINCSIIEDYDLKWGVSNRSRWTLKIPCVHMNRKTGKEDWKKRAIETTQPAEETVFKIFCRISTGLVQTANVLFLGEPTRRCTSVRLTWQF